MPRHINALIADDSVMTRKMIMKDLAASGLAEFRFVEADDGIGALEAFEPGKFDIIFTDMQMPGMDGHEFLKVLHSKHAEYPPAVMITSERSMEVLEKAAEANVKAFLLKPVDSDRLRRGLKQLIDSLPDREGESQVPHGECVPKAAGEILSQMVNLEISPEPEDESVRRGSVVFGSIAVLGEVHWSLVLGFEKEAAIETAARFAGFEIPFDSPDMGDAISELTNNFAGQVKRHLSAAGLDVEISLPVVNAAEGILTLTQRSTVADHRHFRSQAGQLWTSVTVGMNPGLIL